MGVLLMRRKSKSSRIDTSVVDGAIAFMIQDAGADTRRRLENIEESDLPAVTVVLRVAKSVTASIAICCFPFRGYNFFVLAMRW